jgi:hypothetical protein
MASTIARARGMPAARSIALTGPRPRTHRRWPFPVLLLLCTTFGCIKVKTLLNRENTFFQNRGLLCIGIQHCN